MRHQRKLRTFHYVTNCTHAKGKDITAMQDEAIEVTWRTFRSHVNVDEVKSLFPYYSYRGEVLAADGQPTAPMHLKDDPAVCFYRSRYQEKPCYYIEHSRIEYVFVESYARKVPGRTYYKDFDTGKQRWTDGKFIGWSERTGPLNVRYAGFDRGLTIIWIPRYLLRKDSRAALPAPD